MPVARNEQLDELYTLPGVECDTMAGRRGVSAACFGACEARGVRLGRPTPRMSKRDCRSRRSELSTLINLGKIMHVRQYAREIAFVWSAGSGLSDKMGLANATLLFHLSNALRATHQSVPRRYRVNLIGRPHDLWMRTVGGDIFVLHEVFGLGCYDLPCNSSDLRTVVDLGANIGLTTLYLASKAPEAQFICVEPVPANADLLRRNLAPLSRAIVVQAAVTKESGTVMFDDTRPAWGGGISRKGRLRVEAISIDDLLARYAPDRMIDLLKMDIEGAEAEVFSGPMLWLDRVACIIAELHPPFSLEQFRRLLIGRGFDILNGRMMPTAVRR
jgi:FkbM family methyltransferase